MIRIAHLGDPHLTEGQRWSDTLACVEYVIADGIEQGVELWLVGGDMCGTTDVSHKPTILEVNTWDVLIRRMADRAPVVLAYGNHDAAGSLDGYGRLAATHPITVVDREAVIELPGAMVFVLGYPWKRDWLARVSGTPEEKDRAIEAGLRGILEGWRPQVEAARARGVPTLFLGHASVGGAAIAGGETLPPGQEIEVSVGDMQRLGCDYAGFSHLHLCQELATGVWYAGSPSRSNFGEVDPKGYLVVDVAPGRPPIVNRRLTPARPFVTVEATWALDAGDGTPGWILDAMNEPALDGAEVRVRVTVPEEAAATAPVDALVARFREAGAVDVKPERRTVPKQALRCPAIVEAETLEAQVQAFFSTLPTPPDQGQIARCLEKLTRLQRGDDGDRSATCSSVPPDLHRGHTAREAAA